MTVGIGIHITNPNSELPYCVIKTSEERRYTLGVAYPADKADISVARDGHRDFANAEVIEKAAWGYMTKSRNVGLLHKEGTDSAGTVVESYVYRGPDWPINGQVVKAGDWLLGTVWDESVWPLVKAGLITGYSPQGGGRRKPATPERAAQLRS